MKSEMNRWTDEENFFGSKHVSSQIWCYLKLVRWRDEEWDEEIKRWKKKFLGSEHVSSQIWCYLKLVRWRDWKNFFEMKKFFFLSEHVSSQIWCYLKLVRWRDEEWDEQMNRWRKFFWVQTCIKSNLVLSEISEMKRWRVRWREKEMKKKIFGVWTCIKPNLVLSEISEMKRWKKFFWDEKIFFSVWTCIKPNLVLSEISEMKRWRVRWRDGKKIFEMKKKIFRSEHVSSQICCQKFFPLPKKLHPSIQTDRHTDTIVTR